jgi:hypothetical protein
MTAKADEPRTVIKVPVSSRNFIREKAKKRGMKIMDYVLYAVKVEGETL